MYRSGPPPARGPEFYQIGGFGCSINAYSKNPGYGGWKTTKDIAELMFSGENTKSGVDLVFGVKPCGAGYLLIPRTHVRYPHLFPGRVYDAGNYISLSPVHFSDRPALQIRLEQLAQPARKKKTKKSEPPRDRSAANKGYTTHGSEMVVSSDGKLRASFEHQRLLVSLARNDFGDRDLFFYTASPPPWISQIRVVSFACNLWAADHRGKLERGDDLKILDVGWTEYSLASNLSADADATVHYKVKENVLFTNKNSSEFLYGETEVASKEEIQSRLQELLGPNRKDTQTPILLLVNNAKDVLPVLGVLGADTGLWYQGVEPVLGLEPLNVGEDLFSQRRNRYPGGRSDRSRSPRRDVKPPLPSRARSPLRGAGSSFPVYLLDVAQSYKLAIDEPAANDNIRTMAGRLGVETSDDHALGRLTEGWCGGNESRLLGHVWYKLTSGNAIEEQKLIYKTIPVNTEMKPSVSGTGNDVSGADSDEELDPNDPAPAPAPPLLKDPYEALEDEDDDY